MMSHQTANKFVNYCIYVISLALSLFGMYVAFGICEIFWGVALMFFGVFIAAAWTDSNEESQRHMK